MLYFIHGDSKKIFKKAEEMVDSMLSKKPDAVVFSLVSENFHPSKIDELTKSQSLFTKKYIVKISKAEDDKILLDSLLDNIKDIKESDNVFIWVEEKVLAKDLKKIEKHAEKVQEFKVITKQKKEDNLFPLANTLGDRDSKKLWILYIEALKKFRPEEIHGMLWWQIKCMMIARKVKNVQESGLNPFVYNKAKAYLKNYSNKDLDNLADRMIDVLRESRSSGPNLDVSLESLILNLGK